MTSARQGRKCKYESDEERTAIAKEQRDNWRRKNWIIERNIKTNSSPFQKQLIFYLRRNLLKPALEQTLESLFREHFIVISDTLPTPEPDDRAPTFIYDNTTLKIKKRINPKHSPQPIEESID
jgi:hypothetical protein